jgi:recombination protein RecR
VVESPLDLLSFERGNIYHGVYHVLHGRIDPLNNVGPDDIYIGELVKRIRDLISDVNAQNTEVILATNPDMEGDATALYIKKKLDELAPAGHTVLTITRLAYGLPIGASLEYADYGTLGKALENRRGL